MTTITDCQWQQYEREGYLRIGHVLSDDELAAVQRRLDQIMLGQADIDYDQLLMQLDSTTGDYNDLGEQSKGFKGATRNYRKIQDLELDPLLLEYMQRRVFEQVAARTHGDAPSVAVFRAMFMNKPAGAGTLLPWHQDRWEYLDRDPLITIYTAIDAATVDNGCVEIIPRSHARLINPDHPWGFLDEEHVEQHCEGADTVFVELAPGEVVLLHNWTLHRSDRNRTTQPRRALSVCLMDGRTVDRRGERYRVLFGEGALKLPQ